jgi:pSer/pThr/pTyr-binding forkhead associated (FHA) protein
MFGIASALITARISGAVERRRAEREAKSQLDAWGREFSARYAELQATNRPHAEAIRQQFAKAYIRVEASDPKMADRYFIPAGAKLTIGRSEESDIVINDDALSRRSAILEMTGNKLFITDLASRNGTMVNGQRLISGQRHLLAEGDRVHWGKKTVTVHMLPE